MAVNVEGRASSNAVNLQVMCKYISRCYGVASRRSAQQWIEEEEEKKISKRWDAAIKTVPAYFSLRAGRVIVAFIPLDVNAHATCSQ